MGRPPDIEREEQVRQWVQEHPEATSGELANWLGLSPAAGTYWKKKIEDAPIEVPESLVMHQRRLDRRYEQQRQHAAWMAATLEEFKRYRPPNWDVVPFDPSEGAYLLECCIFDPHIGKYAWDEETGENYDSAIAARRIEQAVQDLIEKTSHRDISRVLFPVGNDLMHVDNYEGTTSRGTRQDTDDRLIAIYRSAIRIMMNAISDLARVAPVDVVVIPGNHDMFASQLLGESLYWAYHDNSHVNVDNNATTRKYYRWGTALLGFCHGSRDDPKPADLPLIMAEEAREDWADTTQHEWHLGHWHKKKALQRLGTDSFASTTVRIITSLCGTDAWHHQKGFIGGPAQAEAFLWDEDTGLEGHFFSRDFRGEE